jgi:hypothetical protein
MDSNIDRISRGLASTTSRRQAFKMLGGGLLGGALAGAGFSVAKDTAAQGRPQQGAGLEVTGIADDGSTFVGTLTDLGAALNAAGDGFVMLGSIVGELTDTLGSTEVVDTFIADLFVNDATCEILSLTLGPLHLDLLGLVIDLDVVNLDITAESGAGNLLGNLLCAVTNLLNNPSGALNGIANLLNQILGLLG